jgi:hypothetical protein
MTRGRTLVERLKGKTENVQSSSRSSTSTLSPRQLQRQTKRSQVFDPDLDAWREQVKKETEPNEHLQSQDRRVAQDRDEDCRFESAFGRVLLRRADQRKTDENQLETGYDLERGEGTRSRAYNEMTTGIPPTKQNDSSMSMSTIVIYRDHPIGAMSSLCSL